jgi:hypothetical protein
VIYFVQAGRRGCIEIGYTEGDVEQRVADLQARCPQRLYLLLILEGSEGDEQLLHQQFAGLHRSGEWFWPGRKLLAYLAEYGAKGITTGPAILPKVMRSAPRGSTRITFWIQRQKDRPFLSLQWRDPDTGRRRSLSFGAMSYVEAERRRSDLECQLNQARDEALVCKLRTSSRTSGQETARNLESKNAPSPYPAGPNSPSAS